MNSDFLDKKKEELIIHINNNFPYCFFCGSLSLNMLELINRPIHDVDICVPIKYKKQAIEYFYKLKNKDKQSFIKKIINFFDFFSKNIDLTSKYMRLNIQGIDICIFFENEYRCILHKLNYSKIRISFPENIIKAKKIYVKTGYSHYDNETLKNNMEKHLNDIKSYEKNKEKYIKKLKLKDILGEVKIINL
jgi:hypothetical protein